MLKNLDIFMLVGKATAHDEFIEFELKDDKVYIGKHIIPGAYDPKGKKLKVKFLKGKHDNPKINGIVLYNGSINDTEFAERKKKFEEINKKKLMEAKKAILIEMRHHNDEIYDEEAILLEEEDTILTKEEPNVFNIFKTAYGGMILISLGMFFVLNHLIDDSVPRRK